MIDYLRDPDAIYAQSFATIRAEADLSRLAPVAPRRRHPHDPRLRHGRSRRRHRRRARGRRRRRSSSPSSTARRSSAIARWCARASSAATCRGNELIVTLNDPAVPELAKRLGTTRSAAAVELWRSRVSTAPSSSSATRPPRCSICSKCSMPARPGPPPSSRRPSASSAPPRARPTARSTARGVPFVTVLGRRGGSAIASAAFNAIARSIAA